MRNYIKNNNGFTMVELLVASLIGLLVIGASYMIYYSQQQGFMEVDRQSDKLQNSRITLDHITRHLRSAGFGVISGQVVSNAKLYEMTFRGDTDNDIAVPLAQAALVGDTELKVDLDDEQARIAITDFIWIKAGVDQVLVPVRSVGGPAYSLDNEPDTIYLASPLEQDFLVENTEVRTVETVAIQHDFNNKIVTLNGSKLAHSISSLEFHYSNSSGTEMVPEIAQSLSATDRTNIRKVRVDITVAPTSERASASKHSMTVELRNMEFIDFDINDVLPSPPTNLQITDGSTCGHFTISYTRPTTNVDGSPLLDLAGFRVFYGTASESYWQPAFPVSDEALEEVQIADSRLEDDETYYVAMTAFDSDYNVSELSSEISFTLNDVDQPAAPVDVSATAGDGSITLTWVAPSDTPDIKGYRIFRGTTSGFGAVTPIVNEQILTSEVFSYVDTDIDTCITYYYKIMAVDCENEGDLTPEIFGDGDGPLLGYPDNNITSTTVEESPPTPPYTPSGVAANGVNGEVILNWINPTNIDFAGVIIRWSASGYPNSVTDGNELGTFSGNPGVSMTATHSGLVNGQPYYYSLFAADHCGNYSNPYNISATPGVEGPVVEIISPSSGITINDGQLRFQVRAYDPDEPTISVPASMALDNGKGITGVTFAVDPTPDWMSFPKTEYQTEYCGFGGNTNPCTVGDVSTWCDGTYNLYALATDNEGVNAQSGYVEITIENGGIHNDDTYVKSTSGTYKNQMNFRIKNTADNSITITGMTVEWDRSYARLDQVQIPDTNTVFQATEGYPSSSGDQIYLTGDTALTLSSDEQKTVKLTFIQFSDKLRDAVNIGDTTINVVNDGNKFTLGEPVILSSEGLSETVVVAETGYDYIIATNPVTMSWLPATQVAYVEDLTNCPMASANVNVSFTYQLDWLSQYCNSDSIDATVHEGPSLSNPYQDEPAVDTASVTTTGSIAVENFRPVPLHVQVTDNSLQGLDNVKLNYTYDTGMSTVPPGFGYAYMEMTFDESDNRWEVTMPYSSNTRVWYYFTATDNLNQSERLPTSGAYTFDFSTDSEIPDCPTGFVATYITKNKIALSWNENSETDLRGYNVWRSRDCKAFVRVYTLVSDIDPTTPGIQYEDTAVAADAKCYKYYITSEDMEGNESEGCEVYIQQAGNCPC